MIIKYTQNALDWCKNNLVILISVLILPVLGGYVGYQFALKTATDYEHWAMPTESRYESFAIDLDRRFRNAIAPYVNVFDEQITEISDRGQFNSIYIWSGKEIYFYENFYGAAMKKIIGLNEEDILKASTTKYQFTTEDGSYSAPLQFLLVGERVFYRGELLPELNAAEMVVRVENGYIFDSDTAYSVNTKCDGFVVTKMEYDSMNNDRRIINDC